MKLLKILLYPFAFLLSWYHWLVGHLASKLMLLQAEGGIWFDVFWGVYQMNMEVSSILQDFVNDKGWMWPWGEVITFEDDK